MEIAYCPYCGNCVSQQNQKQCLTCNEDISDIWELITPASSIASSKMQAMPADAMRLPVTSVKSPGRENLRAWALPLVAGVAVVLLAVVYISKPGYLAVGKSTYAGTYEGVFNSENSTSENRSDSLLIEQTGSTGTNQPLVDGKLVFLRSLGNMQGDHWLSANPRKGYVYLAATPDDPECWSCWVVLDPEHDGTIQLMLPTLDGQRLVLEANPGTGEVWLDVASRNTPNQYWQSVANPDGSISLYNLAAGSNPWLDGKTVESDVSMAYELSDTFTGAFWQVSDVPGSHLSIFYKTIRSTQEVKDGCLTGSRLSPGMYAAVIEGNGRNRLRKKPSLSADIIELVSEGDPVQILDGPECGNGIVWWHVIALESGTKGWTAEMKDGVYYLRPLP